MATTIQYRRDTAANWTSENPTLADGEIGLETDTRYFKIGDGSTAWTSLAYGGRMDSNGNWDMGNGSINNVSSLDQNPLSSDPGNPSVGHWLFWISDGTDSFDAGDICVKINVGGTVKVFRLIDFSAH